MKQFRAFEIFAILFLCIIVLMLFLDQSPRPRDPMGPRVKIEERQIAQALWIFEEDKGALPDGDTLEIFRNLYGSNAQTAYLHPWQTNQTGATTDPWGSAYEIKIVGATNFLISSAGENRKLGDKDDVVLDSTLPGLFRQ